MTRFSALWVSVLAALLPIGAANARTPGDVQPGAWHDRAAAAAGFLDRQWGTSDGWEGANNWLRFPIIDALIDFQTRTGDTRWAGKISSTVRHRTGLALNDDDLWAVIASVHAWQLDHDPELLQWAAQTYSRIVTNYWDDRCGGGLWWDPRRTYKNAITNELLLYASIELYKATEQRAYRDWALRSWTWFAGSKLIGPDGLVNDGLDAQCRNNGAPRYTYNQGVLLGALSELTAITGDAQYRVAAVNTALATTRTLVSPDGLLNEPSAELGKDGPMFKGVFAFHLGHLIKDMSEGPDRTELVKWAQHNGEAAARQSRDGTQAIDGLWSNASGQTGAAAQTSGIEILLAASS